MAPRGESLLREAYDISKRTNGFVGDFKDLFLKHTRFLQKDFLLVVPSDKLDLQ